MRLLRDLWATSAPRTAAVGLLMLLWAAGQAGAAALTGEVLVDRSPSAFLLLAAPPGRVPRRPPRLGFPAPRARRRPRRRLRSRARSRSGPPHRGLVRGPAP